MSIRRSVIGVIATAATLTLVAAASTVTAVASAEAKTEYTVLAADNVSTADAVAAIERAGGTVVGRNDAVGMFSVVAPESGFVEKAAAAPELTGAAHRIAIGKAPDEKPSDVERERPVLPQPPQPSRKRPPPGWTRSTTSCGACAWSAPTWPAPITPRRPPGERRCPRHRRGREPPGHRAQLQLGLVPQLRQGPAATSTGHARWRAVSTRSAPTTAATAPTSPAPSARPPTASASPAWRRTSAWSSSRAARTPATSSWSRSSTR